MEEDKKIFYQLGYRDGIAGVLADTMNKIKLPEIAEYYKKTFGGHFSHKWHTTK